MSNELDWSPQWPCPGQVIHENLTVGEDAIFVDRPGKLMLPYRCFVTKNQHPSLGTMQEKQVRRPENGVVADNFFL